MIRRSFYYLWGTQTISNIADIIYIMSLIVLVLNTSNSLMTTIFVPLFRLFSQVISGLLAPIIVSRFRLTHILLFSQFGQFVIFTLLLIYLWAVPEQRSYPFIFAMVFGMSFLDGWTNPARNALVPRLATGEGLMRANGLISVSDQIVKCGGWALSGVIVALIGTQSTMLIASICYFIAVTFTAFIRDPLNQTAGRETASSPTKSSFWQEFSEGWSIIGRNRRIRSLMIVDTVDTIGGTAWLSVFILAFVQQVLHRDASWWGFMNGSFFAGSIAGGILIVALVKRFQKQSYVYMLLALMVYVVLAVGFAFSTIPLVALLLLSISGLPVQMASVIRRTLFQQSVTDNQLPKVMAGIDVLTNLTFGLSLLLLGWYADRFGMVQLYLFAGVMTTIAVVIGWFNRSAFREDEVTTTAKVTEAGI